MKKLIVLFLVVNGIFLSGYSQQTPFDSLRYNKVVAYEYLGQEGRTEQLLIVENGKLISTVTKQVELSSQQIKQLTTLLSSESTYGGDKAFCFIPRMGIVFYNDNEAVANVSICFECNYLISSIHIPATEAHKIFITEDYSAPAEGFSENGKRTLMDFCRELEFEHCK